MGIVDDTVMSPMTAGSSARKCDFISSLFFPSALRMSRSLHVSQINAKQNKTFKEILNMQYFKRLQDCNICSEFE